MARCWVRFEDGDHQVEIGHEGLLPLYMKALVDARRGLLSLASVDEPGVKALRPAFASPGLMDALAAQLDTCVVLFAGELATERQDELRRRLSPRAHTAHLLHERVGDLLPDNPDEEVPERVELDRQLVEDLRALGHAGIKGLLPSEGRSIGGDDLEEIWDTLDDIVEQRTPDYLSDPQFLDACFGDDAASRFFDRYPLAREDLGIVAGQFVGTMEELHQRLRLDWQDVNDAFFHGAPVTQLVGIESSGSDRHKAGRQVLFLSFNGGRRLIYKPSDVELDYWLIGDTTRVRRNPEPARNRTVATRRAYVPAGDGKPHPKTSLIELINLATEELALPTYTILPRNPGSALKERAGALPVASSYGYIRFIPSDDKQACGRALASEEYAVHWGALFAPCLLCSVSDLHGDNVLVSGELPWLIDLENACVKPMTQVGQTGLTEAEQVFQPRTRDQFSKEGQELKARLRQRTMDGARLAFTTLLHEQDAVQGWLREIEHCVARLVPVATSEYLELLARMRREGTDRARRRSHLSDHASMLLERWKTARKEKRDGWEGPPVFALAPYQAHDLLELNIPTYYHRLSELDLRDARGRVVAVQQPPGGPAPDSDRFFPERAIVVVRSQFRDLWDGGEKQIQKYLSS